MKQPRSNKLFTCVKAFFYIKHPNNSRWVRTNNTLMWFSDVIWSILMKFKLLCGEKHLKTCLEGPFKVGFIALALHYWSKPSVSVSLPVHRRLRLFDVPGIFQILQLRRHACYPITRGELCQFHLKNRIMLRRRHSPLRQPAPAPGTPSWLPEPRRRTSTPWGRRGEGGEERGATSSSTFHLRRWGKCIIRVRQRGG